MRISYKTFFAVVAIIIVGGLALMLMQCPACRAGMIGAPGGSSVAMIHVNDIYRIEGVQEGERGGMARLAWLRHRLEEETGEKVPFFHAGDVLSPSLYALGKINGRKVGFNGAEMVDIMNMLDGDKAAFDPLMFVTIGNHEFDNTKCLTNMAPLADRIGESGFTWLSANLDFSECEAKPTLNAGHIKPAALFEAGGIRFGVFGLTIASELGTAADKRNGPVIDSRYVDEARKLTRDLRDQGAEFVIALTHLDLPCDMAILEKLQDAGPDLVMGGHDHAHMAHFVPTNPLPDQPYKAVYKADADAVTAAIYRFWREADGSVHYSFDLRDMDFRTPEDKSVVAAVASWERKLAERACPPEKPTCLEEIVGEAAYEFKLGEHENRSGETRIGDWFASLMLDSAVGERDGKPFCEGHAAKVALVNSGSFRLNENVAAGRTIRQRHIIGTMPFGLPLTELCVSGKTLHTALARALNRPGEGKFPHIAGMQVSYERTGESDADIRTLIIPGPGAGGKDLPIANDDSQKFLLVTGDYIAGGEKAEPKDGYPFGNDNLVGGADGRLRLATDLTKVVLDRFAEHAAFTPDYPRKIDLMPDKEITPICKM